MNTGAWGEQLACDYITKRGYQIITRNFRCRYGEIDIIAQHGDTIVFVEVKTRSPQAIAEGRESVSKSKQRKLRTTAEFYLTRLRDNTPARFDVIEITTDNGKVERIELIDNAF